MALLQVHFEAQLATLSVKRNRSDWLTACCSPDIAQQDSKALLMPTLS